MSALLIGVLGVVLARSIASRIEHRNIASARQTAVLVSRLAVQPRLDIAAPPKQCFEVIPMHLIARLEIAVRWGVQKGKRQPDILY